MIEVKLQLTIKIKKPMVLYKKKIYSIPYGAYIVLAIAVLIQY